MTEQNIAKLVLHHNQFQIAGPPTLAFLVETICNNRRITPYEAQEQLNKLYWNWFVPCSISGELIRLYELKYWDVPTQRVFARPELVPTPECYK